MVIVANKIILKITRILIKVNKKYYSSKINVPKKWNDDNSLNNNDFKKYSDNNKRGSYSNEENKKIDCINNLNEFLENNNKLEITTGESGENFLKKRKRKKKIIKYNRSIFLRNIEKETMSKLNIHIEELDYENIFKYKNIKNIITIKNKREILKYLNSSLLGGNKAKYYILKVLMFTIVADINSYNINELIFILHIYKNNNMLNPFLILHITNKIFDDANLMSMHINEFICLIDILNVPLLITNKFEKNVNYYINLNINKFKFMDYFNIGYFLAKNNLYNETVMNFISHFYANHANILLCYILNEKNKNLVENKNNKKENLMIKISQESKYDKMENITKMLENQNSDKKFKSIITENKRKMLNNLFYKNRNLYYFTKQIHKHLFILSKYGYKHICIYNSILRIIILRSNYLKPLEISSILISLKNLNYFNSFLFKNLIDNIKKNLSQYKTNVLLDCLNVLSFFNYNDNSLITKILVSLPRTISTYTSNDFLKLLFFMNNFIPFSKYFRIFLNQKILYFSSSFGMNHLIFLLKIFTQQNIICKPIFCLLKIKLTKFLSSCSDTTNYNLMKGYLKNTKHYKLCNISLKNLFDIIQIMNFMSINDEELVYNCLKSMFIIQSNSDKLELDELKYMIYSCCYFILINNNYDSFLTSKLYLNIQQFFCFFDPYLIKFDKNIHGKENSRNIHTNDTINFNKKENILVSLKNKKLEKKKIINHEYKYDKNLKKIKDMQIEIDMYTTIILTFITEFVYHYYYLRKEEANLYNFDTKYIIDIFKRVEKIKKKDSSNNCMLKKFFPLIYSTDVSNLFLKKIPVNNYYISTYFLGLFQKSSDFIESEHMKREMIYHQNSLREIYEILQSIKQRNYYFKFIDTTNKNSIFLYTHYIFVKNLKDNNKMAILYGTKNYYFTTINKLQTDLNSSDISSIFDTKFLTKPAIAQLQYFKIFFNDVHLIPFKIWKNMNLEKKKQFFVNLLNL
ncbi:conserved Plasmodium protein, unknown function [Plasmodium gallinaceum]|uniref:Uncharacterized protein n=1 Tax=Plasmodium gallinaceum TaxID=5849 RepID=A0A1J1GM04_PLAGA|nr:conserved Plasmodium protein, unknown function [Plasmodium gallinaceum]CRG93417.1 conserved Plasmodium protein, unknown function [Plasmodium gallinaceum]